MTSKEFENSAKLQLQKIMHDKYGIDVAVHDIQLVWFNYTLGNMKLLLYSKDFNNLYTEVTYDTKNLTMYVNIYSKICHRNVIIF